MLIPCVASQCYTPVPFQMCFRHSFIEFVFFTLCFAFQCSCACPCAVHISILSSSALAHTLRRFSMHMPVPLHRLYWHSFIESVYFTLCFAPHVHAFLAQFIICRIKLQRTLHISVNMLNLAAAYRPSCRRARWIFTYRFCCRVTATYVASPCAA